MSDAREMTPERLAEVRANVARWPAGNVIVDLIAHVDALTARLEAAERSLAKISKIRDSIVGHQRVSISEHVYPLVAALEEAGVHGIGYAAARDGVVTLHGRIAAAEARADAAKTALEQVGDLLLAHGCDCECSHDGEGHDEDCKRCLACRIDAVVCPALRAARGEP